MQVPWVVVVKKGWTLCKGWVVVRKRGKRTLS